jgi:hypothetical protein
LQRRIIKRFTSNREIAAFYLESKNTQLKKHSSLNHGPAFAIELALRIISML